ncbi:MAG: hypothetical protein LBO03_09810 [Acidaminococcales bacterium]|nr:hypothetical protein [Acidaminococcales bacterium]
MIKTFKIIAALVLLLAAGGFLLDAFLLAPARTRDAQSPAEPAAAKPPVPPKDPLRERAEAILAQMTAEEKIGQLLIVGVDGTEINDAARLLLQKYHVGGITLFDRNMKTPSQTAALVNAWQAEAKKQNGQLPLFICIDQEGGLVTRMEDRVSPVPAQEDIAQSKKPGDAKFWAEKTAGELKAMGINVNFAPVADLGGAYKRSYGTDPALVEAFAKEAVKGYQKKGIIACLKHFPGIGKTKVDLHVEPDTIDDSLEVLKGKDLRPFKNIIRTLDNRAFFVMVSHMKYLAYDKEFPASLSAAVMKGLLREELGFKGLIVTDDMEMGALTKAYSFEEMGLRAIKAGADIVLACHDLKSQAAVYDSLLDALRGGSLSKEEVDGKVLRVIMTKLAKLKFRKANPATAEKIVGKQ